MTEQGEWEITRHGPSWLTIYAYGWSFGIFPKEYLWGWYRERSEHRRVYNAGRLFRFVSWDDTEYCDTCQLSLTPEQLETHECADTPVEVRPIFGHQDAKAWETPYGPRVGWERTRYGDGREKITGIYVKTPEGRVARHDYPLG